MTACGEDRPVAQRLTSEEGVTNPTTGAATPNPDP